MEQREIDRDMRKYEIDVRNDGDTKRRLLELASEERIRTMELQMQLAMEKERHQSSLDNLKETNKARIEEARAGREVARAEQEKQKTLRKDAVEASNVRRWELEADLRLAAVATDTKKAPFKRVLGPRTVTMRNQKKSSTTVNNMTSKENNEQRCFTKPRYTEHYLRPRRGSNKEN